MYAPAFTASDDRKAIQFAALNIFLHKHEDLIRARMLSRYTTDQYNKYAPFISPTRNPLRRCAELQSVMYQRPPRLSSPENEEVALELLDAVPDLYQTLAYAQRFTFSVGDLFLVPYWDEIEDRAYVDTIPPHMASVKKRRCSVESVTFEEYKPGIDRTFNFYLGGEIMPWASDMDRKTKTIRSESFMGIDVFPVVWMSINPVRSISTWSVCEVLDLINGTIQIGELEAFHDSTNILKSFRQMYVNSEELANPDTGESADALRVDIGAQSVAQFPINTVELADPNDPFLSTIQKIEADLAATRGISSTAYHQDVKDEKNYRSITEELRQRWRKQVKVFSNYERQLLRVLVALINKYRGTSYDINTRFTIDYFEPEELDNYNQTLVDLKLGMELGIETPVDYVYKYNPSIRTYEDAERWVEEKTDWRVAWGEKMARNNTPKDVTAPQDDPEVNGAKGIGSSGPQNPRSLEYQQEENDARSSDLNNPGIKK